MRLSKARGLGVAGFSIVWMSAVAMLSLSYFTDLKAQGSEGETVEARVGDIFRLTLDQGRSETRTGVATRTNVPPPPEFVREIRAFGDAAVPILAKYLRGKNGSERWLALRFLGSVGTQRIVAPLMETILGDNPESFKLIALDTLATSAPYTSAAPALKKIAKAAIQPSVSDRARELLGQACSGT